MNMVLLTKKLFEQWMETILERLERQDEMLPNFIIQKVVFQNIRVGFMG